MANSPWNTSLTVDGTHINVFSSQVGISTLADATGKPAMGTLTCSMDFSADMHDRTNVPFAALQKFFNLANIVTADKVKAVKVEFWSDDKRTDVLCSLQFQGWISAWNISSGGGSNHVLTISIQPALTPQQYHDLKLGN